MSEQHESIEVHIYGSSYRIRSTETTPPKYIQKIAAEVDKHMRKIAEGNPRLDYSKLAVLAAVHLADERYKRERELKTELMATDFEEAKASRAQSDEAQQKIAQLEQALAAAEYRANQLEQESASPKAVDQQLEQALADAQAKIEQLQHELIQLEERMEQTHEVTAEVERDEFALEKEYQQLKEDYAKLQNEFNEWIEFAGKSE